MSINKKTLLGRQPDELGLKDAVHVAVVSLRAGQFLKPGQDITLNNEGEAITGNSNSFGVVDPFLKNSVKRGDNFWGLLRMQEVPNVRHVWDHPEFEFKAPTTPIKYNSTLQGIADDLGIEYKELIRVCDDCYSTGNKVEYTGKLSKEEFRGVSSDNDGLWSEWSEETGIEFENRGTDCCPEYDYPDFPFRFAEKLI